MEAIMEKLTCFKAYDIRGRLGTELNEEIAWRIGRAYGEYLKPETIVLGGDVRLTSEALKLALAKGLQDAGVDVLDSAWNRASMASITGPAAPLPELITSFNGLRFATLI